MGSLCDRCYAPGACCKGFELFRDGRPRAVPVSGGIEAAIADIAATGLPFVPTHIRDTCDHPETGEHVARWWYACPRLDSRGRCSDYENRPLTCRAYEPRQDALCAMFTGECGDGSATYQYAGGDSELGADEIARVAEAVDAPVLKTGSEDGTTNP